METPHKPLTMTNAGSPQPNGMKLQLNRMLLPIGETQRFESTDRAEAPPLARTLLQLEGVTAVELESGSVSIQMDEKADRGVLEEKINSAISAHFEVSESSGPGRSTPEGAKKKFNFGFKKIEGRPREEQMEIVQNLFDSEVNPAVAAHGGSFTLIDVMDNNVYVQLGGGCQGCGMANVTLKQGVEQRLREVLPEMAALIDTTDHASGNNPYYQPGK